VMNADATLFGQAAGDSACEPAAAGDLNADGMPDIVVSATHDSSAHENGGAAYVVFDAPYGDLSLGSAGATVLGEMQFDAARSTGGFADLDGDGLDDLLAVSTGQDAVSSDAGAVYIVRGPISETIDLATADVVRFGIGWNEWFGTDAAAGDLDGDGIGDLVIASYGAQDDNMDPTGGAFVDFGPLVGEANELEMDLRILAPMGIDGAGPRSVDASGDINQDGRADLIIGCAGDDTTAHNAGAAYIFLGKANGDWGKR